MPGFGSVVLLGNDSDEVPGAVGAGATLWLENRLTFFVDSGLHSEAVLAAPAQTLEHLGIAVPETTISEEAVGGVIDLSSATATWCDKQRWRYAHPKVALDIEEIEEAAPEGLFFAGDAFVGKGRVGASIETGLRAAERILALR